MNALQYKEGKFWLVPDVPDMPTTDADGNEPEHPQLVQYQYDYDQALSNSIEVAEESIGLCRAFIIKSLGLEYMGIKEGEIYPIEGLTYKVEFACDDDGYDGYPVRCGLCKCKQVAIINK